jgi:hypothetical protein
VTKTWSSWVRTYVCSWLRYAAARRRRPPRGFVHGARRGGDLQNTTGEAATHTMTPTIDAQKPSPLRVHAKLHNIT